MSRVRVRYERTLQGWMDYSNLILSKTDVKFFGKGHAETYTDAKDCDRLKYSTGRGHWGQSKRSP